MTIKAYGDKFEEDDSAGTFSAGAGVRYTPPSLQQLTVQLAYDIYGFKAEDENRRDLQS